jgi:anti-anti-sigma regulatory factor
MSSFFEEGRMIDFKLEDTGLGPVLRLCGELTIGNGARLKTILLESIGGGDCPSFDLSEVTEIDTAGFQLLWSASRAGRHSGRGSQLFESLPGDLKRLSLDTGFTLPEEACFDTRPRHAS